MTSKTHTDYSKLDGQSYFPQDEFIGRLKQDFPQVFTEGQIDPVKLKANLKSIIELGETYGLTWKGKSNVFSVIQSTITKTLHPARVESVNFDTTDNLFIEGDNLDALKILQRAYYGKIKMIYIDPPYNTGNDFVYNDHFQQDKEDYDRESGKRNEAGYLTSQTALQKNTKDSGHYHSNWLSMMYSRLYLARNLLRDDGVIFVSIDDNEVHNLRLIMNEIFGEENFVLQIAVNRTSEIASNNTVSKHEYIIVYAKTQEKLQVDGTIKTTISRGTVGNNYQTMPIITFPMGLECRGIKDGKYAETRKVVGGSENIENLDPIYVKEGKLAKDVRLKARWRSSNDMRNFFDNNCNPTTAKINGTIIKIYFENDKFNPQIEKLTFTKITSLILDNNRGSNDLANLSLSNYFEFPKSVSLIKQLMSYFKFDNDVILDFFAGSGTTAHAVMDLNTVDGGNRKWICVQIDENTEESSEAYKAGYKTISDIAKERIRRAGKKIEKGDIGFKVLKIGGTNLKIWDSTIKDPAKLQKQMELMQNVVKDGVGEEDLLLELMVKSGVEPTAKRAKVGEYWSINDSSLIICLAKEMTEEIWSSILKLKPQKLIFLDSSLAGNDQLKTNLILKAEKEKIEITVV
ncbi:MAG: methylase N-4/N-6 domain protein [Microgenomates group bacterium GW2011_GWA2_46_7]|nr:MAG: methylase N-4/N-6 domain protein [Microgenomates group bacterium GW2011_GWA2_46_7]